MEKEIIVPPNAKGMRLDKFLHQSLETFSRTKISTLIDKGNILIDGQLRKPSYPLKGQETIALKVKEEKKELRPYPFEVKIIYEDQNIIVVDKPKDLVVHPPQIGYRKTLVNALLYSRKKLYPSARLRPGIVHRLDRETTGVMVLAKDKQSYDGLVSQFKKREIKKQYRAICWGIVNEDSLVIDMPLKRDAKNRLKMKISFVKSKNASTSINVLKRFTDSSFLSLDLLTGRMHQIRVHLKFLGYPLVGDKKYGIKDNYSDLFLHSYKLGFRHPITNEFIEFTSKLPKHFENFIEERKCLQ